MTSQSRAILQGGCAGLAYGVVLSLLSLGTAGAGWGSFFPIVLSSAPLGSFGLIGAFVATPALWALIGALAVAARAGRFERSAALLPALHVAAVLILIELGDASPGRAFRDALIEAPWPMAAWSLVYVAGQVALWRYLRGTVRHLLGRWIAAGRLDSRKLFSLAWLLYAVSLVIPAALPHAERPAGAGERILFGWEMAWLSGWSMGLLLGAPGSDRFLAWYPAVLLGGNVFMVWSAIVVLRGRRFDSAWALVPLVAATLVACTPGLGYMPGRMLQEFNMRLGPGYYAWVASLIILCVAGVKSALQVRSPE